MIRIGFLSISESVVAKLAAGECGGGRHVASLWRHGVTPLLHATPCSEVGERDSRCLQLPSNPAWTVTVFHAVFRVAVRVPAQRVRCRVAGFRITSRVSIAGHPEIVQSKRPFDSYLSPGVEESSPDRALHRAGIEESSPGQAYVEP